jgi:hypothetical protein
MKGQDRKEVTISAHPSDMQIPSLNKEMRDVSDNCKSRRKNLTIDCDTICTLHYVRKLRHKPKRREHIELFGE